MTSMVRINWTHSPLVPLDSWENDNIEDIAQRDAKLERLMVRLANEPVLETLVHPTVLVAAPTLHSRSNTREARPNCGVM